MLIKNKNLWQRSFKVQQKAQVATLITLLIVVIFLFTVITINIGRLAKKRTELSNAADSAAISLGSQVGSYSYYLSRTYVGGGTRECGSFNWKMFFKVFFLSIFGLNPSLLPTVAFTDSESAPWVDKMVEAAGWTSLVVLLVILIVVTIVLCMANPPAGLAWISTLPAWVTSLIIILTAGTLVVQGYNAYRYGGAGVSFFYDSSGCELVEWKRMERQFREAGAKMQMQEKAVLSSLFALARADTELIEDIHDLDEDGLTNDKVPRFSQEYDKRLMLLDEGIANRKTLIEGFIPDIQTFDSQAQGFKDYLNQGFIPLLRQIESCDDNGNGVPDFDIPSWLWEEGFSLPDCPDSSASDYEECLESFPHDNVDVLLYEIGGGDEPFNNGFHEWWTEICAGSLGGQVKYFDLWYPSLYNSGEGGWFRVLGNWDAMLASWIPKLKTISNQISSCATDHCYCHCCYDLVQVGILNSITQAINKLVAFQGQIRDFQQEIIDFNQAMSGKGNNQGAYSWQDSLGWHHIQVKVGSWTGVGISELNLPYVEGYRKDFKQCAKLVNYTGQVAVEIRQFDEQSKPVGPFAWVFRYNKQEGGFDPSRPETIPGLNWRKSLSVAQYSYTYLPPRLVKAE